MYSENDLLPLSGLQHMVFCERQAALIHVERLWAENLFTAQGRVLHEKVHTHGGESRKGVRTEYSVPLRSLNLGLSGVADVVEYHRSPEDKNIWTPFPVEFKRGKPKADSCDEIQLCAQAMCLEEMLGCSISEGALFYGKSRRRKAVAQDKRLRDQTRTVAESFHALVAERRTPTPAFGDKCQACSLKDLCAPKTCAKQPSVSRYLKRMTQA